MEEKTIREAVRRIERAESVAVTGHTHPDGDSIGSMLALGLGLEHLGKTVYMVSQDGVPGKYRRLPGARKVVRSLDCRVDLGLAVDCSTALMMGERSGIVRNSAAIIGIDHHQFRKPFGFEVVDRGASAVGELVYILLWTMKVPVDRRIAENILTSIIVETNSFRLPKVRPFTFALCAELLKTGVDFRELVNTVYWTRSRASVSLLGICLERANFLRSNRIMWSLLKRRDVTQARAREEDADPIIEEMRSIVGVEVSILFREQKHDYRVSLRSRGRINVGKLAESFGGGGHFDSAGMLMAKSWRSVKAVLRAADKLVRGRS
jgi:bifunctional oligoribonuclease and PAP phosphatase NrnA